MACTALALAGSLAAASNAAGQSLPTVEAGPRPGPDVLYAQPPRAPQLENTGPWRAEPILVSGASAYRDGEFLYQDFLYDDRGARGVRDPTDPFNSEEFAFSPKAGTLTYPRDDAFANNAADLVELRVKPLPDATAFRVTLNTLADPARTAFTIALGSSPGPRAWPHAAGVSSPASHFLTVHGEVAELTEAAAGTPIAPSPSVAVDADRRQIEVRVPRAAWDPGTGAVRMAAGVGLWDPAANRYLAPGPVASAAAPGGRAPSGAALFNLAFRTDEPLPVAATPAVNTILEGAVAAGADRSWWRERAQADALADGDVSGFSAEVDFGKLAAGADDNSRVPVTGHLNRIFASRFSFGQGVDHSIDCSRFFSQEFPCDGRFVGQLQPYALYVPAKPEPPGGYGLTLLMHGLSGNHNMFLGSRHAAQLGERGAGSIVASPLGRGPDGFYQDIAEGDVFEVWADVARRYPLDPSWVAASGYSMGGIGTYRLMYRWPDLFARGAPVVGFASELEQLPSLLHIPLMAWNAGQDELVNPVRYEPTTERLAELGLRFVADVFSPAGHITLAANDEYGPQAAFLGEHRVNRDPARVTYVVAPGRDSPRALAVADHAYWLSELRVRDAGGGARGTIDATSAAFGRGEPPRLDETTSAGTLTGGTRPLAYVRRSRRWGAVPEVAPRNMLDVRLANIGRARVTGSRARLRGDRPLRVRLQSDGAGALRLDVALPAGATAERVEGPPLPGVREVALDRRGARFTVGAGTRTYLIRPARPADRDGGGPGRDNGGAAPGGEGAGGGAGAGGALPFTGLALGLPALLGLALVLAGVALRGRRPAPPPS